MARRLKGVKGTFDWPSIAINLQMISEATSWASSDALGGTFYCFSGWANRQHRAVFRFSNVEAAMHFRLMFDGTVITS